MILITDVNDFNSRKIFKAYYGFRVLYVFPFPSAGHWPMGFGSWQSWYQSNGFHCWFLNYHFVFFLHYCGIRLSNVGSVVIASSILRCFCSIVVFWFYLVCLLWMRIRAWDAPAVEAVDNVEQSFQDDALALALVPRRRGRGSSGRGVVLVCICFRRDFRNEFVGLILCYFDY